MKIIATVFLCVAMALPGVTHAKSPLIKQAFGANIHVRQRIPQAEWDTVLEKASEAGVKWGREEFSWDVIEPTQGSYSWDAYDAVVDSYESHSLHMLGLLSYSASWASSRPGSADSQMYPPDLDAWQEYVTAVATRYAGRVQAWEIWNEPNHDGFWKGSVAEYAELLQVAADAIHAANPRAKVVLGGLSGSDTSFLTELYTVLGSSAQTTIDVVAIHPYRVVGNNFNYAPEALVDGLNTLTNDIYNVKAVMRAHGQVGVPLWLTEVGWTTDSTGVSEATQARYVLRLFSQALAIKNVDKIFWYSLTDTSEEDYAEAHFGLLHAHSYAAKPAYQAYAFAAQHLNRRRFKDQFLPEQTTVTDFNSQSSWEFAGEECTTGGALVTDSTLQIDYRFTGGQNCYAPVQQRIALPDGTQALQFTAIGSDDDTFLRVRVTDAAGEMFQYHLGYVPSQQLFYTVQLDNPSAHWGGDNDGKLDQPLTFDSFVLDDTDGSFAEGGVVIDDLVSSSIGNAYLYRYHKGSNDIYAYWSHAAAPKALVHLIGAGRVEIRRFQKSSVRKTSGNGVYRIRAKSFVQFLQTM